MPPDITKWFMMLEKGWWGYLLFLGLPQCHGSWAGWKYQCQFCYVQEFHALKANMEPANICIWSNRFFVSSWKCGFDSFSGALFFQVGHQLRPKNRTTMNNTSRMKFPLEFLPFNQFFIVFPMVSICFRPSIVFSKICLDPFAVSDVHPTLWWPPPLRPPILVLQSTTILVSIKCPDFLVPISCITILDYSRWILRYPCVPLMFLFPPAKNFQLRTLLQLIPKFSNIQYQYICSSCYWLIVLIFTPLTIIHTFHCNHPGCPDNDFGSIITNESPVGYCHR